MKCGLFLAMLYAWPIVATFADPQAIVSELRYLLAPLPDDLSRTYASLSESSANVQVALALTRSLKLAVNGICDEAGHEQDSHALQGSDSNETSSFGQKLSTVLNAVQLMEFSQNQVGDEVSRACEHLIRECSDTGISITTLAVPSPPPTTVEETSRPYDCSDRRGEVSGVANIYIGREDPTPVYCDQTTDGGGWTAFLRRRRQDPQLNFRRTYNEYVQSFGDPSGEFWLGLENLHVLTTERKYELLVLVARNHEAARSYYDFFSVGEGAAFKLDVSGFRNDSSTAGDSFAYHDDQTFSAYDRDRDGASGGSCSEWSGGGGWWYNYCYMTNPTGVYGGDKPASEASDGYLEWRNWQGYYAYLTELTFMIRPRA